jgi:hypothetical protein
MVMGAYPDNEPPADLVPWRDGQPSCPVGGEIGCARLPGSFAAGGTRDKPGVSFEIFRQADLYRRADRDDCSHRNVLRIQREKFMEMRKAMLENKMNLDAFNKGMRDLGGETNANLVSVFGADKLTEWRKFQKKEEEGDEESPK